VFPDEGGFSSGGGGFGVNRSRVPMIDGNRALVKSTSRAKVWNEGSRTKKKKAFKMGNVFSKVITLEVGSVKKEKLTRFTTQRNNGLGFLNKNPVSTKSTQGKAGAAFTRFWKENNRSVGGVPCRK